MSGRFTVENVRRIYDDTTGDYVEVKPDADGLDLVEIRSMNGNEKEEYGRLTLLPDQARLVAKALNLLANELDPQPATDFATLFGPR